jgi:alpha-L-arabinofuranosidase
VTVLTSARGSDNNSLENPVAVVPSTTRAKIAGAKFDYEFPAQSLTVLRLKTQ